MFRLSHLKSLALLLPAALSVSLCSVAFPLAASAQQNIAGVDVLPSDNVWNTKINAASVPLDANSTTYVNTIGATTHFHPDWGVPPEYGIPFNIVQDPLTFPIVTFDFFDESDAGPYPVSKDLKIEGANWNNKKNKGDRHVLMLHPPSKVLYELYDVHRKGKKFTAGSGAVFHLDSNALRPDGWTSADAAGLPILPGLCNYDEAATGVIKHAFRFTAIRSNGYIWPGRHQAGPQTVGYPPLGQRFRLKAGYSIPAGSSTVLTAILTALKEYGMFLCDGGSNWYMTGTADPRWADADINALKSLVGSDFEAIDESSFKVNADSGQMTTPP